MAISWEEARSVAHEAPAVLPAVDAVVGDADGTTLAEPLVTLVDLPAFPTSGVDGYAVAGAPPWRVTGTVLAGHAPADAVAPGTAVEIATGAMVPRGTEHVLRVEHTTRDGHTVDGPLSDKRDWRDAGEEAGAGEELLPAGTRVTPGVIGLAASCGYDTLPVRRRPRVAMVVFGDELLPVGPPGLGRVRDALGPSMPAWLRRVGAEVAEPIMVADTLDAHVAAIAAAAERADVVLTSGGTMHGPVDHLHPALAKLGGQYLVDTVAVRPGFPMLAASLPGGRWLVGLPGNPQSATIALLTLAVPLLAGMVGAPLPALGRVRLAVDVPGRGDCTHLALARVTRAGAETLVHAGSAMLRGVAAADGFLVVRPGETAHAGDEVDLAPLPLYTGELR